MSDKITLSPIGFVKNKKVEKEDDNWGEIYSTISLVEELPESCFDSIDDFSHLEILFHFNKANKTVIGSEHPRENLAWPKVGIFAQRKKNRPNHIGLTTVRLIERKGNSIIVKGLDAIDGTPILDIKPIMKEFQPKEEIVQPNWVSELMRNYW